MGNLGLFWPLVAVAVLVTIYLLRGWRPFASAPATPAQALKVGDRVTYPYSDRAGRGKATILSISKRGDVDWARMWNNSSILSRPFDELER